MKKLPALKLLEAGLSLKQKWLLRFSHISFYGNEISFLLLRIILWLLAQFDTEMYHSLFKL